jgi:hypothetical protein
MRKMVFSLFVLFPLFLFSCSDNQGVNHTRMQNPGNGSGLQGHGKPMQQHAGNGISGSLQPQQGRYFKWTAPAGWRVSETNSGVTLTSPDGRYSASLAALMRSRGNRAPKDFLAFILKSVPDYRNARIISIRNLPSQRTSYQTWNFIESEVSYTDRGLPVTGIYKVGVANYYNMNDAMIVGFRAANQDYQQAKSFMPMIAKSIVLTNANTAFGNNTLISPKNNPNTAHDTIVKAGQYKNQVQDKSMQKWSNAMRGNEPTYDPATGQRYSSQHSTWDAARGGYVNPNRTTELLNCGTPENPQPCGR